MSVESYLASVQRMVAWAVRDLTKIMSRVDLGDPDAARDLLQAEMPSMIAVWGEAAATIAAEYFEELIDAPAVLADPVAPGAVESMVGWAVGPLYGVKQDDGSVTPPDPGKARRNLEGGAQRYILNTGRNTIRYSAENTPGVGWARVLQGEENCAFCVVLSSRGGVYASAETAGAKSTSGNDPRVQLGDAWHSGCDCQIIAIRDDSDYPEGFSPDKYYDMYMEARRNADAKVLKSSDAEPGQSTILSEMRRLYGMK